MRTTPWLFLNILSIVGLSLLIVPCPAPGSTGEQKSPKGLVLVARKWKDAERTLPGSMLYAADLVNKSDEAQTLEARQMPGGYAGEGKFFSCSLDGWSSRKHRWVSIWSADLGRRDNLVEIELKRGEQMEVCRLMLPPPGSEGQCVRFRFRTRWTKSSSVALISNPVVIGDRLTQTDSPCR